VEPLEDEARVDQPQPQLVRTRCGHSVTAGRDPSVPSHRALPFRLGDPAFVNVHHLRRLIVDRNGVAKSALAPEIQCRRQDELNLDLSRLVEVDRIFEVRPLARGLRRRRHGKGGDP
jgi:hypothetical protein